MKLIGIKELACLLGLSKATIFRLEQEGTFPARVKLSHRAVKWLVEDIENWVCSRKEKLKTNAKAQEQAPSRGGNSL